MGHLEMCLLCPNTTFIITVMSQIKMIWPVDPFVSIAINSFQLMELRQFTSQVSANSTEEQQSVKPFQTT